MIDSFGNNSLIKRCCEFRFVNAEGFHKGYNQSGWGRMLSSSTSNRIRMTFFSARWISRLNSNLPGEDFSFLWYAWSMSVAEGACPVPIKADWTKGEETGNLCPGIRNRMKPYKSLAFRIYALSLIFPWPPILALPPPSLSHTNSGILCPSSLKLLSYDRFQTSWNWKWFSFNGAHLLRA